MPLPMACEGQCVLLVEIRGGQEMRHRLAEMGLTSGVEFTVIRPGRDGPCIVRLKDTRLVLGRGMVHHVFVQPAD